MANRSTVYTAEELAKIMPHFKPTNAIAGRIIHPATGDLTNDAVYRSILPGRSFAWEALGYLDVLDIDQQELKRLVVSLRWEVRAVHHEADALQLELKAVRNDLKALQQTLNSISSLLGVTIPAWATREEVENGDEMGMLRMSAAQLGLTVNYVYDQLNPAYSHEQVETIEPPAGTLVARGSTVTVTINLEG